MKIWCDHVYFHAIIHYCKLENDQSGTPSMNSIVHSHKLSISSRCATKSLSWAYFPTTFTESLWSMSSFCRLQCLKLFPVFFSQSPVMLETINLFDARPLFICQLQSYFVSSIFSATCHTSYISFCLIIPFIL